MDIIPYFKDACQWHTEFKAIQNQGQHDQHLGPLGYFLLRYCM